MFYELFGLFGAALVLYAAFGRLTTLAAITQMGSIQERVMPWASLSRPRTASDETASSSSTACAPPSSPKKKKPGNAEAVCQPVVAPPCSLEKERKALLDHVRVKDKVIYTLSVINVVLTAFIAGAYPQYFYLWHTPKAIGYITHRWYTFREQNQHYLLYDFCYWANGLSLLYVWVFPQNGFLFQILFVVSNGPLAWAVLAFSQSLIFHSAPHMTSVFIHTSPMVLTYLIRWCSACHESFAFRATPDQDETQISLWELVWNATAYFYGWWVVLYYLWVYVVMGSRIKKRGYKTLFDRVTSRGPTKWIAQVSRHDLVQKAAYMLTHVVFALFTMSLTAVYWRYAWVHLIFGLSILSVSAWNASGFYFTVFVARYEEELLARAKVSAASEGSPATTAAVSTADTKKSN